MGGTGGTVNNCIFYYETILQGGKANNYVVYYETILHGGQSITV